MFGDSGNLWAMLVIHSTDVEAAEVYLYSVITTPSLFFELFFCKKIPLSRRVEYVKDGSMDHSVSELVSE